MNVRACPHLVASHGAPARVARSNSQQLAGAVGQENVLGRQWLTRAVA